MVQEDGVRFLRTGFHSEEFQIGKGLDSPRRGIGGVRECVVYVDFSEEWSALKEVEEFIHRDFVAWNVAEDKCLEV